MKLRFSPRAAQDLAEIADYLRKRNPAAAQRVRGTILDALQNLLLFPHIGRVQTTKGVRKLVAHPYRYLIYYTVDEAAEDIRIVTIQHPAHEREHDDA